MKNDETSVGKEIDASISLGRLLQRTNVLGPEAISLWGVTAMKIKACEELAELTVELCKDVGGSPTTMERICDEIADVLLMTHRLRMHFDYQLVDERFDLKLTRLEKAIERGQFGK